LVVILFFLGGVALSPADVRTYQARSGRQVFLQKIMQILRGRRVENFGHSLGHLLGFGHSERVGFVVRRAKVMMVVVRCTIKTRFQSVNGQSEWAKKTPDFIERYACLYICPSAFSQPFWIKFLILKG
jgi:hypothetical protein